MKQHRHNSKTAGRGPRRRYARYCPRCGWGFTPLQWKQSRYCPRCRFQVRRPRPALPAVTTGQVRVITPAVTFDRAHTGSALFSTPEPVSPAVTLGRAHTGSAGLRAVAGSVGSWAISHPITTGFLVAGGGLGLTAVAGPLLAAGSALTAIGATITQVSVFVGIIAGLVTQGRGLLLGLAGLAVGAAAAVAGGVLLLAGTVVGAAGLVTAAIGGGITLYGGVCWMRRNYPLLQASAAKARNVHAALWTGSTVDGQRRLLQENQS